ncbi:excisionase [Metamycoplasma equirhinis]|nr:excisionase [Metamycoplasma equirhinis]
MYKNDINFKLIPKYYEILFYWSFINFQREEQIINSLKERNFNVKRSNIKLDAIFKVDLIVAKDGFRYFLQIKNQAINLTEEEHKQLINFSNKRNYTPILVYKSKNNYIFINLLSNKEIFLV